jgi:hypothetical protein
MRKLIFILLLTSCVDRSIKTIDGCDYIETVSYTGEGPVSSLTHKGNCRNPIHINQQDTLTPKNK